MSIEAMKQALEALEHIFASTHPYRDDGSATFTDAASTLGDNAIASLRTAIEQAEKQEPVASYKGPDELWLQLHGDCSEDELEQPVDYTFDGVTWCWHQIHDSDVRYVRADLATPPAAPVQEEDLYDLAVKANNGGQP